MDRTPLQRHLSAVLALALGVAVVFAAPAAQAQPAGKTKDKPASSSAAPAADVAGIKAKLRSPDAAQLIEGLTQAQAAGPAAAGAAGAIEGLLEAGSTMAAAKAAIEALGAIGAPSSSAVLRRYLRHRTPDLRRAAVRALGATKGPEAALAFKEGLRRDDGIVRGFSASGLGALGQADALPDLFLALDHGVSEAAASIGTLCAADDCERFAGKLGKVPFDVMTSGFDPILFRDRPLAEDALLKIVGRVRELGTPEAGRYLLDVQGRWPASGSKKVKQALDSAVTSIPGARAEAAK